MQSVLVVSLSPTFQKQMVFKDFKEDEVNRCYEHTLIPSGKGINVSRVLSNLGRPSVNLVQLGGPRLDEFLDLCKEEDIVLCYAPVKAGIRSCVTIINEKCHTSTEMVEEAYDVEEGASERIYDLFLQELPKHSAVIISGTKPKGFSSDLFPRIVRESRKAGKLVILDIKGEDLKSTLSFGPSVIKPNLSEFCATFSISNNVLENEENEDLKNDVELVAADLYKKYGVKSVITRGKYDTWIYDGTKLDIVKNVPVKVVNTIGCGDTLTAALTHSLLEGNSLKDAVAFGMDCAVRKAQHLEQGIN